MKLMSLIEDLDEVSVAYANKFGISQSQDWFILKLSEELGELVQSYLKYTGQARCGGESEEKLRHNFEDELADVIGMALITAKNHDVDIEEALTRKWLRYLDLPRSTP